MVFQPQNKRHPSIDVIFLPRLPLIALIRIIKLTEGERIYAHLVSAPAKFRHDIRREHLGIASRHIHIGVGLFHQTEDDVDKPDFLLGSST